MYITLACFHNVMILPRKAGTLMRSTGGGGYWLSLYILYNWKHKMVLKLIKAETISVCKCLG